MRTSKEIRERIEFYRERYRIHPDRGERNEALQVVNLLEWVLDDRYSDPIVTDVCDALIERSVMGMKKYGTTLEQNKADVQRWLQHLQEELMDASLYIEKLKKEMQ